MSKVLSISSSSAIQRITETMFRQIGYSSMDKAKSSAEATTMIGNTTYDLILVGLGDAESIQFVQKVRQELNNKTPILVSFKDGNRANVVAATQAGANGYLVQPFDGSTLKDKLTQMGL